jgi:hypothetical protein
MTVQELIDELAEFNGDQQVYILIEGQYRPPCKVVPDLSDSTVIIEGGE